MYNISPNIDIPVKYSNFHIEKRRLTNNIYEFIGKYVLQ